MPVNECSVVSVSKNPPASASHQISRCSEYQLHCLCLCWTHANICLNTHSHPPLCYSARKQAFLLAVMAHHELRIVWLSKLGTILTVTRDWWFWIPRSQRNILVKRERLRSAQCVLLDGTWTPDLLNLYSGWLKPVCQRAQPTDNELTTKSQLLSSKRVIASAMLSIPVQAYEREKQIREQICNT